MHTLLHFCHVCLEFCYIAWCLGTFPYFFALFRVCVWDLWLSHCFFAKCSCDFTIFDWWSHISREVAYIFLILLRCAPFISQCKYVSHSTEFGLQFDVLGEILYFFPCVSAELLLSLLLRCCVLGCWNWVSVFALVLPSLPYIARFREVEYFSFWDLGDVSFILLLSILLSPVFGLPFAVLCPQFF